MGHVYPSLRTVLDEFRDSGSGELRGVTDDRLHWLLAQALHYADQAMARLDQIDQARQRTRG